MTNDIWDHDEYSSTAIHHGWVLRVESSGEFNSWTWCVENAQGSRSSSSSALDRIGACVKAEKEVRKMQREVFIKHGVVEPDEITFNNTQAGRICYGQPNEVNPPSKGTKGEPDDAEED